MAKQRQLDGSPIDAGVAKHDGSVIKQSQVEAETLGVVTTPALFINGAKIEGALPLPFLFQIIYDALRSQRYTAPCRRHHKMNLGRGLDVFGG
jgi:protein-disulfide isomerase